MGDSITEVPEGTEDISASEQGTINSGEAAVQVAVVTDEGMSEQVYDYTDVYATDGSIVDCATEQTTHWFEQVVVGFKEEADGTVSMVDIGNTPEYYEDVIPATPDELVARCDTAPPMIDEEVPELVEFEEAVVEVPVTNDHIPAQLAETGSVLTMGLVVVGTVLVLAGLVAWLSSKKKKN